MGHAKTLSEKDIRLINHMYECSNKNGEGDKADEGEANDDEPDMVCSST
jgi:hypothetical protein